ncbi:DUF1439 domain-containing protein [Shewanella sedimentimangrovi]|uniref:DUF1439 domain-containing protein n=1 Tax=Shewanella sedimentimangrovi TaxID=2814293 RepID=A0ABX7R2X5_9GAMM|nr:DUF1439 domain-containing protein [Shewanella sedimentimangrovi]QSX37511.1 DUF1439 domain-containing protein [Shewanella sedimentimangrovi]
MNRLWLPLLLVGLLGGCVSQYSISENQIESFLDGRLGRDIHKDKILRSADIRVNQVEVRLGHKPDTMAVKATSVLELKALFVPLRASLTAEFEAKPWYDSERHAVYLRDLELLQVESSPKELGRALQSISPQLMLFLRTYLESEPVYVLDVKESQQALMAEMTRRIRVQPGKLVLEFK